MSGRSCGFILLLSSHFNSRYARRLMSIICEEGLACVNPIPKVVMTPTSTEYHGTFIDHSSIVVISIIRAGDSMLVLCYSFFFPLLTKSF
jgi:uracil phosphoribosyltransferase